MNPKDISDDQKEVLVDVLSEILLRKGIIFVRCTNRPDRFDEFLLKLKKREQREKRLEYTTPPNHGPDKKGGRHGR